MDSTWWQETVVYQICVRSFFDSDGDGIGDLAGIIDKLDYLHDLGVETLWLTPFYRSPQRDFGYDISDYLAVAPEYGDLATFDALLDAVHARGMKLIIDMVLNHTSDEHPWFQESRQSRAAPRRDWYIWRDGRRPGGRAPPNNWRAMIGGRGWHHDAHTDQWYWAQFLPCQPDLNYRNPAVRAAMFEVVRFWLARGVDGMRLDIINALFEDEAFRDNPFTWRLLPSDDDLGMLFTSTAHSLDHPDSVRFARELRALVDSFDERPRFLVGETVSSMASARRFLGARGDGLNLVFSFQTMHTPLRARPMRALIERLEATFPAPLQPTWVLSNHDRIRRIARMGHDLDQAKLDAAVQLTVRAVPFVYYGEELGMEPPRTRARDSHDALAHYYGSLPQLGFDASRRVLGMTLDRDESRTPMHWDASAHAGFSTPSARPWLYPAPSHVTRNVANASQDPASLLACYRRFLHARRATPALARGALELMDAADLPAQVLGFRRIPPAGQGSAVTVLLNMSARPHQVHVPGAPATLLVSTHVHAPERTGRHGYVALEPWQGLVLCHHRAPS